jgi:hypothetical protein
MARNSVQVWRHPEGRLEDATAARSWSTHAQLADLDLHPGGADDGSFDEPETCSNSDTPCTGVVIDRLDFCP